MPAWLPLGVAVLALILALISLFWPSGGAKKYGDQEAQDAKGQMCTVTGTVRQATSINTNMSNPVPDDPVGGLAVAANARLALYGGGNYLHEQLEANPATPADLAKAVENLASTMQQLGINYLAGASADSPVQQPLRDQLTGELAELDQLCQ